MTTRLELGPTFSSVSDLEVFHSLPRSRFLDVTQCSQKTAARETRSLVFHKTMKTKVTALYSVLLRYEKQNSRLSLTGLSTPDIFKY